MRQFNVPFLGEIGFDRQLEDSLGDASRLLKTDFAQDLRKIVLNAPSFRLGKES
jgi:hypothetical protein